MTYARRGCVVVGVLSWAAGAGLAAQEAAPLRPVDEYWDYHPVWSPDGGRIAFCSSRGSHPQLHIHVMNADGTGVTRLTDGGAGRGDCFPTWSPDGRQVAFTSDRSGNRDVWVVEADGSGLRQLTRTPHDEGLTLSWSPAGDSLVIESPRSGDPEVWIMPVGGGESRRVTERPGFDGSPVFTPDGRSIVFTSNRGMGPQIWAMDRDGSNAHPITDMPGNQGTPSVSPDGQRVLFYSEVEDPQYEIYSIGLGGTDLRRLTRSYNWDLDAQTSPDGTRVAFHSSRNGRYGIVVMDAATGAGRTRLSNTTASHFVTVAMEQGVPAALEAYRRAKAAAPDQRFVLGDEIIRLVHDLAADERADEAVALADFGFDLVRDSTEGFELLSTAYRAAGRQAPPGRSDFYALLTSGRYKEARNAIELGLSLRPRWWILPGSILNRMGYRLLGQGDANGAVGILALYPLSFPEDPNGWDSLGEAEQAAGRTAAAREHFATACRLGREGEHPAAAVFCEHLGVVGGAG